MVNDEHDSSAGQGVRVRRTGARRSAVGRRPSPREPGPSNAHMVVVRVRFLAAAGPQSRLPAGCELGLLSASRGHREVLATWRHTARRPPPSGQRGTNLSHQLPKGESRSLTQSWG